MKTFKFLSVALVGFMSFAGPLLLLMALFADEVDSVIRMGLQP